jgi:hypothetical protein
VARTVFLDFRDARQGAVGAVAVFLEGRIGHHGGSLFRLPGTQQAHRFGDAQVVVGIGRFKLGQVLAVFFADDARAQFFQGAVLPALRLVDHGQGSVAAGLVARQQGLPQRAAALGELDQRILGVGNAKQVVLVDAEDLVVQAGLGGDVVQPERQRDQQAAAESQRELPRQAQFFQSSQQAGHVSLLLSHIDRQQFQR